MGKKWGPSRLMNHSAYNSKMDFGRAIPRLFGLGCVVILFVRPSSRRALYNNLLKNWTYPYAIIIYTYECTYAEIPFPTQHRTRIIIRIYNSARVYSDDDVHYVTLTYYEYLHRFRTVKSCASNLCARCAVSHRHIFSFNTSRQARRVVYRRIIMIILWRYMTIIYKNTKNTAHLHVRPTLPNGRYITI